MTLFWFVTRHADCLTWLSLWPDQPGRCASGGWSFVSYWVSLPI